MPIIESLRASASSITSANTIKGKTHNEHLLLQI
jgi:hypothetical protein